MAILWNVDMKLTRLFTGTDQESHFEDLDIPLIDHLFGKTSVAFNAEHVIFGEIEDIPEIAWHNTPCRQYIIMLQGVMEIEIGSGEKRIFNEGDVLLAEDTVGRGHITRAASKGLRRYVVIALK